MKAAVNTRYGSPDVIEVREVPKPEPAADEVLVRVHASTVSRTDCGQLRAHPFFVRVSPAYGGRNAPSSGSISQERWRRSARG